MKLKVKSVFEFVLPFLFWTIPVLSMFPNVFSSIDIYEKIMIYSLMLIIVTLSFFLIKLSFWCARKNNLLKKTLPCSDCKKCENILCCLRVARPGVNYKENVLNLTNSNFIDEFALATLEGTLPLKEVWIISPDLSYECKDTFFTEVVRQNLKKGIKYKFITQDNADSRENLKRIYDKYTNWFTKKFYKNRLRFYTVNAPELAIILSLYSIVVYNPDSQNTKYESHMYVCVGENGNDIHSIYKEIDNEKHINATLDTIRNIIISSDIT